MKFRAYYTTDPDPVEVPDDSYIIIEADNILDCMGKCADIKDKYFWDIEEVEE